MVRSQCICGVSPYPWYSRPNRYKRLNYRFIHFEF